jgi:hypothetical protein
MNNNDKARALYEQAVQLVDTCRRLDYAAILAHRPEAVAALSQAVDALRLELPRRPPADLAPAVAATAQKRRRRLVEALSHAGLGSRLGKLYCSAVDERLVPFREVPHKRGLPAFDMVVAADFAPVDGYHGIFIAAGEVFSGVLPLPADAFDWQRRERVRYTDLEQMVDRVASLSAGFPVE